MLNKYLSDLKTLLEKRNVKDVDDIIDYFNEMINDRLENGEELEEIINSLGEVNSIAENFGEESNKAATKTVHPENENHVYTGIEKLKLENVTYDFQILPGNDDKLIIEYEKDSSTYLTIKQKDNTLYIVQEFDNILKGLFSKGIHINGKSLKAIIHLPDKLEEARIENVSGDLLISNNTISKIKLENVSGDINLDNISCDDINVESVSGDVLVKDLVVDNRTEMEIVSGGIIIEKIRCSYIKMESVSGDIKINIDGKEADTNIHIEKLLSDKKTKVDSDRYLKVETVSGDIKYRFLND